MFISDGLFFEKLIKLTILFTVKYPTQCNLIGCVAGMLWDEAWHQAIKNIVYFFLEYKTVLLDTRDTVL